MSLKRVFAVALAVLMGMALLPMTAFGELKLATASTENLPGVQLLQPVATQIIAGGEANVTVYVKNNGTESLMGNLKVQINKGLDNQTLWGKNEDGSKNLQPEFSVADASIESSGYSKLITFQLRAAENVESQTVELEIIVLKKIGENENEVWEQIAVNSSVFVQIQEADEGPGTPVPPPAEPETSRSYPVNIDNGSVAPNLYKGRYFRTVALDYVIDYEEQFDRITATVGQPGSGVELENMEYSEILVDDGYIEEDRMRIRVRALPDAVEGFYTIPITITAECADGYETEDGENHLSYQLKTYVKVVESEDTQTQDFYISQYQVDNENIQYGDQFNFSIDLVNTGTQDLENIQVRISGLATEGLTLVGDTDVKYIGVDSGETETLTYRMEAGERISTGRYPVTITAAYTPTVSAVGEEAHTETVTAFIMITGKNVEEEQENKKHEKPVIIIDSYTYGGENVTFGSQFPLTMILRNTSSSAAIRNLKVTLSDSSGVFSPTKSSNTFFVQNIVPGGTVEQTVEFLASYPVSGDSNAKSYTINVAYEYEAMAGGELMDQSFSSSEVLSIPLVHTDRFSAGELYVEPQVFVGQQSFVNLNFINEGKSTVYNLNVNLEGENMTVMEGSYYVGNMQSGTQDSFEAYFTPIEAGTVTGAVVFTYEDANNMPKEVRKEFTVEAIGFEDPMMGIGSDMPIFEEMPVEEPSGSNLWLIIGGAAAAVAVAGAGTFAVLKVRKKRRSRMEDEDL